VNYRSIVLSLLLGATHVGFAYEKKAVAERVQLLEEQRGYQFKKRQFQGIAKGELLYWKANIDGVAYATTSINRPLEGGIGEGNTHIKTRTPHFPYDPGFRLELGMESPYDLFDVNLIWTRFFTEGSDRAHGSIVATTPAAEDKIIQTTIGLINPLVSIPHLATAQCHIHTNVLDVQLARGILVSPHFFMRPFFGVRAVDLGIDWRVAFRRAFLIPSPLAQDETKLWIKNRFWAAGGLVGIDFDWRFAKEFGIQTHGAGALVYGLSRERTRQRTRFLPALATASGAQSYKAHNTFYTLKGVWELFAGFFWEHKFTKKGEKDRLLSSKQPHRTVLRIVAGYEFQQWPLIGQKTIVQDSRERERFGLGLQGFTGGVKLVF
jgi:hypothetical protein